MHAARKKWDGLCIATTNLELMGLQMHTCRRRLPILCGILLVGLVLMAGHRLSRRPPIVLVGPADPVQRRVGPVIRGMSRNELIHILGSPLQPREVYNEARYADIISTDYFAGIYADVGWYNDDIIASMTFNLDKFAQAYGCELGLILQCGGRTTLLTRDVGLGKESISRIRSELGLKEAQVYIGEDLVFLRPSKDSCVELRFSHSDMHLVYIGINL